MKRSIAKKALPTILLAACLSASISIGTGYASDKSGNLTSQLDRYFEVLAGKTGFSGAVLIEKEGKIILDKGYGLANDKEKIAVTNETVFDIGSITKQFTAAAILKLEEHNVLSVNDPISKFFNGLPDDKKDITIHQLLTHTAGFDHDHADDLQPINKQEALKIIFSKPLQFKPGTKNQYSNTGYTVLAAIIEAVSGKSYVNYMGEDIFKPAGLNHTGFYRDSLWLTLPVSTGYVNGKETGSPKDWPGPYWGPMGNGEIQSTTSDMYQWCLALENHSILSKNQVDKLFTPYLKEVGGDSYIGYGWVIENTPYGRLITHNGGGIGGNADVAMYPDTKIKIIILSNRITYRELGGIPFEVKLPATETSRQLIRNITANDFSVLPSPTLPLYYLFIAIGLLIIIVLSIVLVTRKVIKRRRKKWVKRILE